MKTRTLGSIIILLGLIMLGYSGFTYFTKEKVVDLGAIQITKEKEHQVKWSPIVGGILVIGGIALAVSNKTI